MDYTRIDPQDAINDLMTEKATEFAWKSYAQTLDSDAAQWCSDIAAITGSGDKGLFAAKQSEDSEKKAVEEQTVSDNFLSRIDNPKSSEIIDNLLAQRKKEFLPEYIKQVETEYAQNYALSEIAKEQNLLEVYNQRQLDMLRCEAAQQIALSELRSL